jgi:hypothetical protein
MTSQFQKRCAFVGLWLVVAGCQSDTQSAEPRVGLRTAALISDPNVIGFEYRITPCESDVPLIESLFSGILIGSLPGNFGVENLPFVTGSSHRFTDYFQTLAAGCYTVEATPIAEVGGVPTPYAACAPARKTAEVVAGQTTEIVMISQCVGTDPGALDSLVVLNHDPEIVDLWFPHSKFGCKIAMCFSINDVDGDPMRFQIGFPGAAASDGCHVGAITQPESSARPTYCTTLTCEQPGSYQPVLTVYDQAWTPDLAHPGEAMLVDIESLLVNHGVPDGSATSQARLQAQMYVTCEAIDCLSGQTPVDGVCVEIDECVDHPCEALEQCTDHLAPETGYSCTCEPPNELVGDRCTAPCERGYEHNGEGECVDIDGCRDMTCMGAETCHDVPAAEELESGVSHHCTCDEPNERIGETCEPPCGAGTVRNGETGACSDIDGCVDVHDCAPETTCVDVPAPGIGHSCECLPPNVLDDGICHLKCVDGMKWDPETATCVEIDGCLGEGVSCPENEVCHDLAHGSDAAYECRCDPPNVLDAGICHEACGEGQVWNGMACEEIDGCIDNPCGESWTCTDIEGSGNDRTCTCSDPFEPVGDACLTQCGAGTERNEAGECVEIDGCLGAPCAENYTCTDVLAPERGYVCVCEMPFELDDGICHPACPGGTEWRDGVCAGSKRRVFVTSQSFKGAEIGGRSGGDDKCNAAATAAALGGNWVAWLSDSTTDARDLVANVEYQRIDGSLLASNLTDLLDGTIATPISLDENGNAQPGKEVWTGTSATGVRAAYTCNDWTSSSPGNRAQHGKSDRADAKWTEETRTNCNASARIYCFEQ